MIGPSVQVVQPCSSRMRGRSPSRLAGVGIFWSVSLSILPAMWNHIYLAMWILTTLKQHPSCRMCRALPRKLRDALLLGRRDTTADGQRDDCHQKDYEGCCSGVGQETGRGCGWFNASRDDGAHGGPVGHFLGISAGPDEPGAALGCVTAERLEALAPFTRRARPSRRAPIPAAEVLEDWLESGTWMTTAPQTRHLCPIFGRGPRRPRAQCPQR